MANPVDVAKKFVNKVKDFFKNIKKILKFLATKIGQITATLLLVIFIVILFQIIGEIVIGSLKDLVGINWNYDTYTEDLAYINGLMDDDEKAEKEKNDKKNEKNGTNAQDRSDVSVVEYIKQINNSGYGSMINAENYQNFKAFEYSVLMDAAEYLRTNKQEMFDIGVNEGQYQFERNMLKNNKPNEYSAKLGELSALYANVDGNKSSKSPAVKLLEAHYSTDQSGLDANYLSTIMESEERSVEVEGAESEGTVKGGTNRVKGPYFTYEFKGVNNVKSSDAAVSFAYVSVDPSKITYPGAKDAWNKYSNEILFYSVKYGLDPYFILAVIMREADGQLNCVTWNDTHTDYAFGLMQTYYQNDPKHQEGLKNYKAKDITNKEWIIDCTDEAMMDNAAMQIEAGTSDYRRCMKETNYDMYKAVGKYGFGSPNDERLPNYWNNGIKKWFFGGDESWVIKKDGDKYYKVYTNLNTHQISRTEEVEIKPEDIADLSSPAEQKAKATSGSDTLEPYVYIVKENIEFSYYFDESNNVIQYPLILNAFNSKLNVGQENGDEINRALLGLSPVVWPNESGSYTWTPYYSDKSTPTIYKIPLRTILGRYLPKQELLLTWSMLKQNVNKEVTGSTDKDFMDYVIECIKGIYSEACLEGEDFRVEESERKIVDTKGEEDIEIAKYSNEKTHNKTFATFSKVGIETTKYDINGLQPVGDNDGEKVVQVVTDFINALIIKPSFSVEYSYEKATGEAKEPDSELLILEPTMETVKGKANISLKDLSLFSKDNGDEDISVLEGFDNAVTGNVIIAEGDPESGYIPPSSLEGETCYYIPASSESEIVGFQKAVRSAVLSKIASDEECSEEDLSITMPSGIVQYKPVFIVSNTINVKKKLKIEHTRMPALLVSSAQTWCRNVSFEHNIVQNQFKQNDANYIIPNSVSGTGLAKFETTVKSDGYRGKAYSEVFSVLQEKDVINMMLQFESLGKEGFEDSYEYMRDLYRLVKASQKYSIDEEVSSDDPHYIHPDTYTYVYVPDSIGKFNDLESQKIYWLNLLTSTVDDPLSKDEINNIRTRNKPLSWQVVEYDKYDECNDSGTTQVFALSPFASPYLRTYYETMFTSGYSVTGNYNVKGHSGADWGGRVKLNDILQAGDTATTASNIGKKIYNYEFKRLERVIGKANAKNQIQNTLKEQSSNNPIVAIAPGKVDTVAYSSRSGFYVKIQHSENEGVYSYYMHLKRWPEVSVGDYVGAGTILGYEGNTGRSFGAHLHFQLEVAGTTVGPAEYIFPTFNPFYYEEKAAENKYDLTNDYMSLERTVRMVNKKSKDDAKIINRVPEKPLLESYDSLILDQGRIERTLTYTGSGDWCSGESFDSVTDFSKYLEDHEYYDLYLEAAFFDRELATQQQYLVVPNELLSLLYGNITVKTDMPGGLPALTKDEFLYILQNWLSSRYKNSSNVQWLMNNVFTSDNIDAMLEYQDKYKVSLVFALAVATQEQNLGLSRTRLALDARNLFSIKWSKASGYGYILYQNGKQWNNYGTYANAFDDFMKLISERGPYFKNGRYTIGTIAPVYCEGNTWGPAVSKIVMDIMKHYSGSDWSMPAGDNSSLWGGDNPALMAIIKKCMAFYVKNEFKYCQGSAGRLIPPYDESGKVRQQKHVCEDCAKHCSVPAYRTDCSTYVSWVIYEYAKANGFTELQNEFSTQHSSYVFEEIGSNLQKGEKNGFYKYLQLVQYGVNGNFSNISSKLQPGDILVYREGTGHHVEFVSEEGTKVYSCGRNPDSISPQSSYTTKNNATCAIRLMPSTIAGTEDELINSSTSEAPEDTTNPDETKEPENTNVGDDSTYANTKSNAGTSGVDTTGVDLMDEKVHDDEGAENDDMFEMETAGEALLKICKKTIKYLKKNNFTTTGKKSVIPPYKNKSSNGDYGTPVDNKNMTAVGYLDWVLHEYGVENDVTELRQTDNKGDAVKERPADDVESWLTLATKLKEVELSTRRENTLPAFGRDFDLVFSPVDKYTDTIGNSMKEKEIKSTLKPGDILISYLKDNKGKVKVSNIEIFAGFEPSKDVKDKSIGVKVYSMNNLSTASSYTNGEPQILAYEYGGNSTKGFNNIGAVIRLKDDALGGGFFIDPFEGEDEEEKDKAYVHFINTGENADAIFIQAGGKSILIDGGTHKNADKVISYLDNLKVTKVDCYIGTQSYAKTVGAAGKLIQKYQIKKLYYGNVKSTETSFSKFATYNMILKVSNGSKDEIDAINKCEKTLLKIGNTFNVGDLKITCIGPVSPVKEKGDIDNKNGRTADVVNNNSLILRVVYKNTSFLLAGGANDEALNKTLSTFGALLDVDVYKNGNHAASKQENIIKMISPKYTVFTTNNGNQPTDEYIKLLKKYKSENYINSSSEDGTVVVITDGDKIEVKTSNK